MGANERVPSSKSGWTKSLYLGEVDPSEVHCLQARSSGDRGIGRWWCRNDGSRRWLDGLDRWCWGWSCDWHRAEIKGAVKKMHTTADTYASGVMKKVTDTQLA